MPLPPVRPGTPRYRDYWQQHRTTIEQIGVAVTPSADLRQRAIDYAQAVWRTPARPEAAATDRCGRAYMNAEGQIAAQLFAEFFGTHCDWTIYDRVDQGWDVQLGDKRIDVKARRGWLTIPTAVDGTLRLSSTANLLALVQTPTEPADPYVLVGTITPAQFRARAFRVDFGYEPSYAVLAGALEPILVTLARLRIA
jgi:hypothetical protein